MVPYFKYHINNNIGSSNIGYSENSNISKVGIDNRNCSYSLYFVSNYYNLRFNNSTYSRTCSSIDSISNTICKSRNKCERTIGSGV